MKITNQDILNFDHAMNALSTAYANGTVPVGARKLPMAIMDVVRKNRRALEFPLQDIKNSRQDFLLEHAKTKDGEVVTAPNADGEDEAVFKSDAAKQKFEKKMEELLALEYDIKIHQVTPAQMDKLGEVEEWVYALCEWLVKGYDHEYTKERRKREEDRKAKLDRKVKALAKAEEKAEAKIDEKEAA